MGQDVHDDSAHGWTPVPSECEGWPQREVTCYGMKNMWLLTKPKQKCLSPLFINHYHPNGTMSVLSASLHLWQRRSCAVGQQLTLVICVAEPWLEAIPDGIVGSGIIVVKCPFVCRECSFEKAAATKCTFCLQKTQKGLCLSSKHQITIKSRCSSLLLKQSFVFL